MFTEVEHVTHLNWTVIIVKLLVYDELQNETLDKIKLFSSSEIKGLQEESKRDWKESGRGI